MAKFIVIYTEPTDKEGFEKHYNDVHIPLVNDLPHKQHVSVNHVVEKQNTTDHIYLHVEIEYENLDLLNESLASEQGQKVKDDAGNLAPFLTVPPTILITE